ncbi:MAG: four helix bundle suffix domain-containing protein [Verrucomicrobia bacterium]|nr:four helix bundle suffix domain-containing protein [Verrucomicrobiota bacterium]MBU1909024.1 four helix bundle suffix domain-containing protein [Verrucomicrobiota bacterium]
MPNEPLIPPHGGYRKLKSFQLAELVFDLTVRFCDQYIPPRSRTHDQMVQAARSGVQNIAEGSQVSGTSKKMEIKLTSVARASLEELRRDFEDFLRQKGLPKWEPDHTALQRLKVRRCATLDEFRAWVANEVKRAEKNTDGHRQTRTININSPKGVRVSPCSSVLPPIAPAVFVANGALCLLNLCCYLLDRQMAAQASAFEKEGGFTERLYQRRSQRRQEDARHDSHRIGQHSDGR